MNLIPCPFCGLRPEIEFSFGGEAGKTRPEPAAEVLPDRWAAYLYVNQNGRGETGEIWAHATCGELFLLDRNTVTHAVAGSSALRGEPT